MYLVGGMVRDRLLGRKSKDADFAVEAESFEVMVEELTNRGFELFQTRPEYCTVRAQFPDAENEFGVRTADFVLCRVDGFYSNGRRPDSVKPGTLLDDLSRRDFTINAMAMDQSGEIIDPFYGQTDLMVGVIRCVGDPDTRISEDFLRAMRAVRFSVVLDFQIGVSLLDVLRTSEIASGVAAIPHERRRDELTKMMAHDTIASVRALRDVSEEFFEASLTGLKLLPTSRKM